ncbi:hypothetical protein B5M47_03135 [candidate division CPR3 bacterium 4484_211]|uniref:Uncharacterized protein n=1 Tax=candidate division CPR3 bacterium 4484_211 TaxID=1968527 RepID=A0A1W9NXH5_UNCC3|nr:MAG: hypothetical protein B5M47_03135 [candidate division CPR3 bacterium 4484_211]
MKIYTFSQSLGVVRKVHPRLGPEISEPREKRKIWKDAYLTVVQDTLAIDGLISYTVYPPHPAMPYRELDIPVSNRYRALAKRLGQRWPDAKIVVVTIP